jgi:hypothetical protein
MKQVPNTCGTDVAKLADMLTKLDQNHIPKPKKTDGSLGEDDVGIYDLVNVPSGNDRKSIRLYYCHICLI